jgi:hypothetical protein
LPSHPSTPPERKGAKKLQRAGSALKVALLKYLFFDRYLVAAQSEQAMILKSKINAAVLF